MRPAKSLAKFEQTHTRWRAAVEAADEAEFARVPEGGGWSLGQLCDHVVSVATLMLDQVERCAFGRGKEHGFSLLPALVSALGSMPPVRVKVPPMPTELAHIGAPKTLTRAEALARLSAVAERTRLLVDTAAQASPRQRTRHPVGGWLNARHWYQLHEIHLRHHLRQLKALGRAA